MIVGDSVGITVGGGQLMRNALKSAEMVRRGHESSVGKAEAAEIEGHGNLTYGWLGKGAVKVVELDGLLKELNDVVVMLVH